MAERPKRKESDMAADPVFDVVKSSQCLGCANNKGVECNAFGHKPMKYMDALSKEKCPHREEKK